MSLYSGFFNSSNHDRLYDSEDIARLFDGLIRDGIFASIGGCLIVKPNEGMMLAVDTGRAWFNHTWTYNDAILPVTLDTSEVLLKRIDAVVLEVNSTEAVRANAIKVVKGTPANSPVKPTLTKSKLVNQYALAYVTVNPGVTSIGQADIENIVGTDATPFVSGILEVISIDKLIPQWKAILDNFVTTNTANFNTWMNGEKQTYNQWLESSKSDYNKMIADQKKTFETNTANQQKTFESALNTSKDEYSKWYNSVKTSYDQWFATIKAAYDTNWASFQQWEANSKSEFDTWFANLKSNLDDNIAIRLEQEVQNLDKKIQDLDKSTGENYDELLKALKEKVSYGTKPSNPTAGSINIDSNGLLQFYNGSTWATPSATDKDGSDIVYSSTKPNRSRATLWIDTGNSNTLKFVPANNGDAVELASGSGGYYVGTTAPSNTKLLWIKDGVMKYYNGSSWANVQSVWG